MSSGNWGLRRDMYQLRLLDPATRELASLERNIARRIVNRLNWLAENLEGARKEALSGDLSGFYKFRVGDYRIFYQVWHDEKIILVHKIGHRREIYRER